jgi:hypothetical protein
MKFPILVRLVLLLSLVSCNSRQASRVQSPSWTVGFWIWAGSPDGVVSHEGAPIDSMYVQVETVNRVAGRRPAWPDNVPPAKEYWAVWRFEPPAQATQQIIPGLVADFEKVRNLAANQGETVVGLQLDYDCPTRDLPAYSRFLTALKKAMPAGTRISITALLDWFRQGTAARGLVAQVSEYVPQFYDVGAQTGGIAEEIDPARWAPVFNSLDTPYRIGISTFGRISLGQRGIPYYFRDLSPLDVLGRPQLKELVHETTPAGETRFVQRVLSQLTVGYGKLDPDDIVETVLPTRKSVQTAYAAARKMGGLCAGVLFFRWPSVGESLVLTPGEVMNCVRDEPREAEHPALAVSKGDCVAVHCWDLQLSAGDRFPPNGATYRILASQPLEYFIPQRRFAANIAVEGKSRIIVRLPPYHGHHSLSLGRAVTLRPATFLFSEVDSEDK